MTPLSRTCLGLAAATLLASAPPASAQPAKPPPPSSASAQPATTPPSATAQPATTTPPPPSASASAPTAPPAPDVYTEPRLSPSEEAAKTFQDGREAFKADDFERALALFERSNALEASPGTLLNIAITQEKLGRLGTALVTFQRVVTALEQGDDRLPIAKEGVARMTVRAPRLKIERAAGAPPTLAITIDDRPLAANLLGVEQPFDPGRHVVTTRVYGFKDRAYEVTLTEGQRLPLAVEPGERILVDSAPAAPARTSPGAVRTATFVLGGFGLASLGVGAVTGILAIARRGELDANAGNADRLQGEGRAFADVSTATFALGGVALAAGALLFFTVGRETVTVSAGAGPGAGSLVATGRF